MKYKSSFRISTIEIASVIYNKHKNNYDFKDSWKKMYIFCFETNELTCEHKRVQRKLFSYLSFEHSNLSAHKRLQLQLNKKGHQIFRVKNMYFLLSGCKVCQTKLTYNL